MKRAFFCMLALAVLLTLAACEAPGGNARTEPSGETVSVVGTWRGTLDGMRAFARGFDGQSSESRSLADYLKELPVPAVLCFEEDGTYTGELELSGVGETLRAAYTAYLRDVLADLNDGVSYGDEELTEALGTDLDSYVARTLSDAFIAEAFGESRSAGSYTVQEGVITLDDGSTGSIRDGKLIMVLTDIGETVFSR